MGRKRIFAVIAVAMFGTAIYYLVSSGMSNNALLIMTFLALGLVNLMSLAVTAE